MSQAAHKYLDDIERDWKALGGGRSLFDWFSFCFAYVFLPLMYATLALTFLVLIGRLTLMLLR